MEASQGKGLGLAPDEKDHLAKDGVDERLKAAIIKVAKEKPADPLARSASTEDRTPVLQTTARPRGV